MMTKKIIQMMVVGLLFVVFCTFSTAFAKSGKEFTLRASYFSPADAEAGFAFGGSIGYRVDEFVALGFGTDFLYKTYKKSTEVATKDYESGISTTTVVNSVQYNTLMVPMMGEVTITIPVFWKLSALAQGGVGYEILWNKEENFETKTSDSRLYGGFTYQLGAGVRIGLGRDSGLFAEGYYNHAKVKRNAKDIVADLPVFEQVDLSGFGARAGIMIGPF
jgi:hypothetical protein